MMNIYKSTSGARAIQDRYVEVLKRWPVASEHLRVPTRQGETFVIASGPPNAPPVLLFQGSGANSALWMKDVPEWAAHFRVFAVDLIGEPGLSAPSRPPLQSDAYALWLDDVMHGLSLTRASLVGVSLGGWLALDYATRRPERVERVALLCPSGVGRQKVGVFFRILPLLLLGAWGRRRVMRMLAGATPANPPAIDPQVASLVSLIQKHFRPRRGRIPVLSDEALRRLSMPVMLVVGGCDVFLDSAGSKRRLEAAASRVTVRFLPEAGHLLPAQTRPILEFLCGSA